MNDSSHRSFDRKLMAQVVGAVLALSILYAASIGPVLLFASKIGDRRTTLMRGRTFYRPVLRWAVITHWEQPLCGYLHFWSLDTPSIAGKVGTEQYRYGNISIWPHGHNNAPN